MTGPVWSQRVGRGIALLFHDRGTRRGWVVSSTPQPHFMPGKDSVPILQEAGWAPGPVWMGTKSHRHRVSIPDRPAHSQSLYRLSYPVLVAVLFKFKYCATLAAVCIYMTVKKTCWKIVPSCVFKMVLANVLDLLPTIMHCLDVMKGPANWFTS